MDHPAFDLSRGDRTIPAELASVEALELRIWDVGFDRFEDLAAFQNLVELEIMDYRADSFAPLGALRGLRRLHVVHFPRVRTLEALSGLERLEALTLETLPSWDASRKRQVVESFRPLAAIGGLQSLRLAGVCARDGDLSPLGELRDLRELSIANLFRQEQFALLSTRLPASDRRSSHPSFVWKGTFAGSAVARRSCCPGSTFPTRRSSTRGGCPGAML